MKKYIVAFVFFVLVSALVTSHKEKHAHKSAAPSEESGRNAIRCNDAPNAEPNPENPNGYAPGWNVAYLVFGWPNGVTVWALFLTMMVIAEQTRETRRAANATHSSVELQELVYVQWINIEKWDTSLIRAIQIEPTLRLQFDFKNPTSYPLTLKSGLFTVKGDIHGVIGETFCPPQIPFSVDERFLITEAQVQDFIRGRLEISFDGTYTYIGVLRKEVVQQIKGTLVCGLKSTSFVPYAPITDPRQDAQKKQNPN